MHSEKLISEIIKNIAFCTFLSGEKFFNVHTNRTYVTSKKTIFPTLNSNNFENQVKTHRERFIQKVAFS